MNNSKCIMHPCRQAPTTVLTCAGPTAHAWRVDQIFDCTMLIDSWDLTSQCNTGAMRDTIVEDSELILTTWGSSMHT